MKKNINGKVFFQKLIIIIFDFKKKSIDVSIIEFENERIMF